MTRHVEVRTYKLEPGTGATFHELVTNRSMPLVRAAGTDVVGFGPSLHEPDAYFLIRAYDSPEHREASQAEFYGSAAWREGPREAMLARVELYLDAVMRLSGAAVEALRPAAPRMSAAHAPPGRRAT